MKRKQKMDRNMYQDISWENTHFQGMVSNKMLVVTIFGHKHFNQKFHQFVIFYEKISTTFNIGSYLELNC